MRPRSLVIALLAVVVIVLGVRHVRNQTGPDASKLLLEAAARQHHIDYTGLVRSTSSFNGREIDCLTRVYHKGGGDRMEYLSSPVKGMVVVDNDRNTFTYQPRDRKVLVSTAQAHAQEVERVRAMLQNYRATVSGEDTVAGRPAVVVDVASRRDGNPSKRIWIDRKTLLVLRQEDRTASGEIKSSMAFQNISYTGNIPDGLFTPPAGRTSQASSEVHLNQPMSRQELSKRVGFAVTEPSYIPSGYTLAGYQLYRCQCACSHDSAHIRYSDGLNSISVFETSAGVKCGSMMCEMAGGHKMAGSTCSVGDCRQAQVGRVSARDKSVVVVADLPPQQIERIAKSVK